MPWFVTGLRATVFWLDNHQPDWTELGDGEPDSHDIRNNPPSLKSVGSWNEESNLTLSCVPGRSDWLLTPRASSPTELAHVGQFSADTAKFMSSIRNWLSTSLEVPVWRVAFGADLDLPAQSREDAYKKLQGYLAGHFVVDASKMNEFFVRLNRKRVVPNLNDLEINRIRTWQAIQTTTVRIFGAPNEPAMTNHACRLSLDISSGIPNVTENYPELENPSKVFDHLVNEGLAISKQGENV